MAKDYYKILGVERSASEEEIKKAFRVLDRDASGQFVPLKGVTYQQFDEDGKPVKPPKKRGKKLPAAEAVAAE